MNGNEEGPDSTDSAWLHGRHRDRTRMYRRSGGHAAVVAAAAFALAALALAACGGGSSNRQVASPGTSGGNSSGNSAATGRSTTALPKGSPAQLLDEWAACMRSHGDRGQAPPAIDASKLIHMTIAPTVRGGYSGNSGEYGPGGPGLYCTQYLEAAQKALGHPAGMSMGDGYEVRLQEQANPAALLRYSQCMQASGIRDFPNPTGNTLTEVPVGELPGGDLSPGNPKFLKATRACAKGAGVLPLGAITYPGMIVLSGTPDVAANSPGGTW
jgi:hypothetical protein